MKAIWAKCPSCKKEQYWNFMQLMGTMLKEVCEFCKDPIDITEIKQEKTQK